MKRNHFLEATLVYLRPLEEEDDKWFYHYYNEQETRVKIGGKRSFTKKQAKDYVNRNRDDCIWFGIVKKENDEFIGVCGLIRMDQDNACSDLSIIIADKIHQQKGYGTQAMNLLLDYAFGTLRMHRIAIGVVGFHKQALSFYEKVGFRKEGIWEECYYVNYAFHDFIMMRILDREFQSLHQK